MNFFDIKKVKRPGYYWWLPLCDTKSADNAESWNIVSLHPNLESTKSGIVYGPIEPQILSPWVAEKFVVKHKIT